ncbi:anti-sigma factor [Mitsuaria sp. GD03876]|uniref:anti-sigma factor family protein n=1 Tax=Mitsuaria sp. GD03876 TaxID=2975399 RepID=UPI00244B9581|nr:anti-sigma factor [Mitsuaria sp. GD03876]MDH0868073.1 anti-sigma factor [Mitsuaria sp. GD03876]
MTHDDLDLDEATLHAYVDGQLDPARAAAVADWLLRHPRAAQQVLAWREQRESLQALHRDWLDEPVPPRLAGALRPPAANAPSWPRAWAAALLVAVGLGAGAAGGWGGHAWWYAKKEAAEQAAVAAAARAAGRDPSVPDYVRDAAIAHAVYQPEVRHPVEVGADQADHLVQWLSKRLGAQLYTPVLRDYGWKLVGGRLLPAGDDPVPGARLARAQFMYENDAGERFTLYVSAGAASPEAPVAFRLTRRVEAGQTTRSLYWIEGKLAYALSGNFDEQRLRVLADLVHARISMTTRPASAQ